MIRSVLAPAKINLFLHVAPLAPDGYHPLASLMSFADVGDTLTLEPAERTSFTVIGTFAEALAGEDPAGNLAWRAVLRLLQVVGVSPDPFRLTLDKALPVAAGLGGGSSDAGAALRLVRDAFAPDVEDATLESIAAELGADGPACFHARPVLAQGRGEALSPPPAMPPLPTVLVNPGVACPTGRVYRTYDEQAEQGSAYLPALPAGFADVEAVVRMLASCRNDLERPALTVAPQIVEVLSRLRADPLSRLARLSGSGATCFALCDDAAGAMALAHRLTEAKPQWWVQACTLAAGVHEGVSGET